MALNLLLNWILLIFILVYWYSPGIICKTKLEDSFDSRNFICETLPSINLKGFCYSCAWSDSFQWRSDFFMHNLKQPHACYFGLITRFWPKHLCCIGIPFIGEFWSCCSFPLIYLLAQRECSFSLDRLFFYWVIWLWWSYQRYIYRRISLILLFCCSYCCYWILWVASDWK